jgi:hypothetical protein
MRSAWIVIVAGICFLLPVSLTGEDKPTVQLAGLRIVGPGYGLNASELRAFYQPSGTTLALAIRASENKKIVEVDDAKCSMVEFADDRGYSLLDGVDWGGFPKTSKDGRFALIEVTSKNRPSQGASRLLARGTIHLRVAASESTEKIENLKLEVGIKVNVGQEVIQVMKVQEEDDGLTLVLQINRTFVDNMKDLRFYKAGGDPVDVLSIGSFTFGNASQMEYNLDIKTAPAAMKIEIDLWQELETLNLSFEIESGVGF